MLPWPHCQGPGGTLQALVPCSLTLSQGWAGWGLEGSGGGIPISALRPGRGLTLLLGKQGPPCGGGIANPQGLQLGLTFPSWLPLWTRKFPTLQ